MNYKVLDILELFYTRIDPEYWSHDPYIHITNMFENLFILEHGKKTVYWGESSCSNIKYFIRRKRHKFSVRIRINMIPVFTE